MSEKDPFPLIDGFQRIAGEHFKLSGHSLADAIATATNGVLDYALGELARQELALETRPFIAHGTIDLGAGQSIVITIELKIPEEPQFLTRGPL
jgi:hypothetical protein